MEKLKHIKSFNKATEKINISADVITKQNNKFYITDNSIIEKGDTILYKIGKHKDYPPMFGICLGFDIHGFILIHDDMSIDKSLCTKLIEIKYIETKISD